MQKREYISFDGKYLGNIQFSPGKFPESVYKEIESREFKSLGNFQKHERISQILFEAIQKEEGEVFLLPRVVAYIAHVREVLPTYHLSSFEFWLNQYAEVSEEEKMRVRGKIVGKCLPRSEYQNFFPLQKEGYFPGSHYSCAHISPDLDTTIASFACFLAAFGAKVGEGRHHWVIPGGPPKDSMEIDFFFKKALGEEVFGAIGSSSAKLIISALDLISQQNIIRKKPGELTYDIDPERRKQAVILVDDNDCYLGDWRAVDVDPVSSIIIRFRAFLAEYQNNFIVGIITLFSRSTLHRNDWISFLDQKFLSKFSDGFSAKELTEKQRALVDKFIQNVLSLPQGCNATIGEFFEKVKGFGFSPLEVKLKSLMNSALFDKKGEVIEDRGLIFKELEEIFSLEKEAFNRFFRYIDSLEVALEVKRNVLGRGSNYLSHLSEYEEIFQAMKGYQHLTVNYQENGSHYPLGVIYAEDVNRRTIATTSWNDFSNPNETDMKEGVEVISFIDHHKSFVNTTRPAFGIVRADAQSSNSIMARINFEINDRYSTGGMTLREIEKGLKSSTNSRILQRLLQKKGAAETRKENYVSREREILEYVQYIFAILDDTDLLTKVTAYDVDGMAGLLNRLKSLMLREEVEIVNFDEFSRGDPEFAKKAAKKLLQTHDLYSLYGVIYKAKEESINKLIQETTSGVETHFFQDTKVLGGVGYAAVGQFKHFVKNEAILRKHVKGIRKIWLERSQKMFEERPEVLMHMFMLSTISSAEELFSDSKEKPLYADELWFWIPDDKRAQHYLKNFLQEFYKSPKAAKQELEVEFCGAADAYEKIFADAFHKPLKAKHSPSEPTMAILKVGLGSIKSRKADIATYL